MPAKPLNRNVGNDHADAATRLAMYRSALRIRMVEEEIVDRYSEQEMRCPTHIWIGQKGIPAGVSSHLRTADTVFSAHRSHGHSLAKGGELQGMLPDLRIAQVDLTLADGSALTAEAKSSRGDPVDSLSAAEISTEFLALTTRPLGLEAAENLRQHVLHVADLADITVLANAIRHPAAA